VDEHSPNAFILDLSLDDGSELAADRSAAAAVTAAVIVVFTGHKNELLKQHCLQAGADAVVVKDRRFRGADAGAETRPGAGNACGAGSAVRQSITPQMVEFV
jgi:DNA-binding NarL/FixJ family response regulator